MHQNIILNNFTNNLIVNIEVVLYLRVDEVSRRFASFTLDFFDFSLINLFYKLSKLKVLNIDFQAPHLNIPQIGLKDFDFRHLI